MLAISSITIPPAPTATNGQATQAGGKKPHASTHTALTATVTLAPIAPSTTGFCSASSVVERKTQSFFSWSGAAAQ